MESKFKAFFSKWWVLLLVGLFIGLGFAAMIVGISGAQLWASFKGRYLTKTAAGASS